MVGGLGVAALVLGTKLYLDELRDAYLAQVVQDIRAFFATIGPTATVYIDQTQSDKVQTKGGVIMEDGKVYRFDYLAGEIFYEEEA